MLFSGLFICVGLVLSWGLEVAYVVLIVGLCFVWFLLCLTGFCGFKFVVDDYYSVFLIVYVVFGFWFVNLFEFCWFGFFWYWVWWILFLFGLIVVVLGGVATILTLFCYFELVFDFVWNCWFWWIVGRLEWLRFIDVKFNVLIILCVCWF